MIAAPLTARVFLPTSQEAAKEAGVPHAWGETPHQLYENWMALRLELPTKSRQEVEDETLYSRWLAEMQQQREAEAEGFMNIGY